MKVEKMNEIKWLSQNLNYIFERPAMYGSYNAHVKSVVKYIFHVCCVIIHEDWEFACTQKLFASFEKDIIRSQIAIDIESGVIRMTKWGDQEGRVRKNILMIYTKIWLQIQKEAHYVHIRAWIDALLMNPPFLRSPNEVDLILNVLMRLALGENRGKFVDLYHNHVVQLRGYGNIGLSDWQISSEFRADNMLENPRAFTDVKTYIQNCLSYIGAFDW